MLGSKCFVNVRDHESYCSLGGGETRVASRFEKNLEPVDGNLEILGPLVQG